MHIFKKIVYHQNILFEVPLVQLPVPYPFYSGTVEYFQFVVEVMFSQRIFLVEVVSQPQPKKNKIKVHHYC